MNVHSLFFYELKEDKKKSDIKINEGNNMIKEMQRKNNSKFSLLVIISSLSLTLFLWVVKLQ